MRLLHFDYSERLISTDFSRKTIPPYAILSHRWGDSEVLFEDLGTETCKEKEGYRKIEFCAKQAAQDQLQYFWIDTCCIDRWNRPERSKAINSMFRWYKDATKCYVFLPDVSIELPCQSDWEVSFQASEWFTRGWTLQELIAPVIVEFFSSEGRRLGDKQSLEQLLHKTTRIPVEALQNCALDRFTVSERMKWAGKRETTEEEDSIYCLLGILDIFMLTSYGEGKENAWKRLETEIKAEAVSGALSIIPFLQNDQFVGRESQLADLEATLLGGKQSTIVITGPGGTGKSQLALELAYRIRGKNHSVFWIDASDKDSLHQSYTRIAQKLDIPSWDDGKADVKQLVKYHLSRESSGQWLLIYDNTDKINEGSSGVSTARATDLIDYLPRSELGSIIFMITNSDRAKRLTAHKIIELEQMPPDAVQKMLENYLKIPISRSEQEETTPLLQELSYLPLAIVQAAAYINTRKTTLRTYRTQLLEHKGFPVRSSRLPEGKLQNDIIRDPVAITLLISMDQIRRDNPLAADYLFLAACMDRKDIPLELLEASSPLERDDAIKVLSSYALITRRPAESALDLHQLVHSALRWWLSKSEMLEQWTQRAITRLCEVFPDDDHGNRSKWRRLLPHAKYALSNSVTEQENEDRTTLAWKCAMVLDSDGWYKESEELFTQVMETRKRVLGEEHTDTLTSMANLASTYRNQGRWKKAEKLEVQVLKTRKRVLGDEHADTLISMANLALTYKNQGRWKEAEELQTKQLDICLRVFGDEHQETLTSMANLASIYRNQRRSKEAEELQVKELDICSRVLGNEHLDTLASRANLASTYWNQGRLEEAEKLDIQVIDARKRVLGDEHPDTLTSIGNLASTYVEKDWWKEAEELEMQVLEARKRVLGNEHPDTLITMSNLAFTLKRQSRTEEALLLMERCFELRKRVIGPRHIDTESSLETLNKWRMQKMET